MRFSFAVLTLVAGLAAPLRADAPWAEFTEPTTRYAHGVLGDAVEWGALRFDTETGPVIVRLPDTRVFEDLAPREVQTPNGTQLAMVVESDVALGARLSLYTADGLYAATPFIGRSHRWLAPVGAADLDGDGALEIAYVDRPHLAKTLRVWRLDGNALREVASLPGVTNHQIGWDFIVGGIRDCGQGPEIVLASHDWREVLALRLLAGDIIEHSLGALSSLADLEAALACR